MPDQAYKRCKQCGVVKSLDEYYRDLSMRDNHLNKCKECQRARNREWRRRNPERAAFLEKRWRAENKDRQLRNDARAKARQAARHPEKTRARRALLAAVASGKVVKPSRCEKCNRHIEDPYDLHGHHEDYSRALDVVWLCRECHMEVHGVRRRNRQIRLVSEREEQQ